MRHRTKFFAISVAVVLALIWVWAATSAPVNNAAASKRQIAADVTKQQRLDYEGFMARMSRGESLTPSEKEQFFVLDELFRRAGGARDPLDNTGGPDGYGYSFMDNVAPDTATYEWIELRGDPDAIWFNDWTSHDDGYATTPGDIGFSFPFYGQTYTQFTATTNGQIEFGGPNASWYSECAPQPDLGPMIMVDMYDAHVDYGGLNGVDVVGYKNFGTYTVIEYDSIGRCCSPGTSNKFEVILYNTGRIKLQYGQQVLNGGTMGSVAIQNADASTYLAYRCQMDGNGTMPIEDGLAIWVYLPNGIPSPVTNLNAVVNDHTVTLTWLDPTEDTNGNPITLENVQVWLGPVESGQLLATVNPGVQTYVHTNAPDGNLTYNVRAFNDPYYSAPVDVDALVGLPGYFSDFDLDNGEWTAEPDPGWEWGAPTAVAPHSDPNVWAVGLNGSYPNQADWYMYLDPGLAISNASATFEFWINYSTESWWDGANLQISIDDGATWQFVTPDGDYPYNEGNPMWNGEPGWSGFNGDWQLVVCQIGAWSGETPQFRFHFASDGSVQGTGVFIDDMIIWGLQPPAFAPITGTVTLDGVGGNITQTVVRANGVGSPTTNPAANGSYTLANVMVGERRIIASLTGYHSDTLTIVLPEGGFNGANLTIRRLNPPAPTNLTASVSSETGIATLDWDTSPDAQVDFYNVFRKLNTDQDWVLIHQPTASADQDTVTAPGIYQYAVTAVDDDVVPPAVESARSNVAEIIYGELPPSNLVANGNFDDRIRLSWLSPGVHPAFQLFYDDSSSEAFYVVDFPNGQNDYFAVRFSPPSMDTTSYPLPVQTVNVYMERSDLLPSVHITPDNNGAPDLDNPWMTWTDIGADGDPGWLTAHADGEIVLEDDSDFWVAWQFPPGINGPGTGSDFNAPDSRSYWTGAWAWPDWQQWTAHDWMARVWVGGEAGWGMVMSTGEPTGYNVRTIPCAQTSPTPDMLKMSGYELDQLRKVGAPLRIAPAIAERAQSFVATVNPFPVALNGRLEPYSMAPSLVYEQRPGRDRALDDVDYYKVYRDDVFLAQSVEAPYFDIVGSANENVEYSYYVTAHYDNDEESGPTNTQDGRANMAPAAPAALDGNPSGQTQMLLTWVDPTVNADGTPCVDLASARIYRDGELIGTVAAGVQQYTDTPPDPETFYTWTVRAIDEVPNEGPASQNYAGAVISPWETQAFEWVDILDIGSPTGLTGDDQTVGPFDLGFEIEYFDQIYNQVWICSNGWVTLSTTGSARYWNACLPDPEEPNTSLDLFFDDLYLPSGGQVVYYQDPGGYFVVTWDHVPHISAIGIYTMQVIIGADGSVVFNYLEVGDLSAVNQATVGVEDPGGTAASLQLWCMGTGYVQPADSLSIGFWAGPRIFGPVSGNVALDGGNGNITQVAVHSNGFGQPTVNPAANGDYAFDSVQVGNRIISATLAGYHLDSAHVFIPESGVTDLDFVLRRLDPPVPMNLDGSVNSGTGQVTLDWDNSTDPLVDSFRVYRKLAADQNWVLIHTRPTSDDTDLLTVDGIYNYSVSAVDYGVTPPAVESGRSTPVTVLYGELPPTNLVANGSFDDRIRLSWLSPGVHPAYQLFYDDSSSEQWYRVTTPNMSQDYFAVRFTPPDMDTTSYPVPVQTVNVYMERSDLLPNVWITPDNGGLPDLDNPWMNWQEIGADGDPGWLTAHADGAIVLENDNDFWVVWQFPPGLTGPGTGSDASSPDSRSWWTYELTWPTWNQWLTHDWMARVWIGGEAGWGVVMSTGEPSGYNVRAIPTAQTSPTAEMIKMSGQERDHLSKASGPVRVGGKAAPSTGKGLAAKNPFPVAMSSQLEIASNAPPLVYQQRPGGGRALDDIEYYKIYRDGTLLATDVEEPPYDDIVGSANENVSHTYWVRAHYDNNQDSDTSNHATRAANMAPGEPTGLDGEPIGSTQMHLTWTDPAVNADGTPCVDLASVRVFRDGTLIGTVAAGVQSYTDTPPESDMFYTWTVRGIDEVPNVGPASAAFIGAVTSPWETVDYEWIDIVGQGTSVTNCDDCVEGPFDLGFEFEYYGQTYTSVYICSNGWVSVVPPPWVVLDAPCFPDPSEPNGMIGVFVDDLLPSGGQCRYYANAADEQFIVSWVDCPHYGSGEMYTFEIILGSDGSIIYQYMTIPITTSTVIGVENADGSMGLDLHCQADGAFTPTDGSAVGFWAGPSGELQGIVRQSGTNTPIEGVRVETQEVPEFTFTDAAGFYSLPLEPGTYSVRYSKQGYCDTLFTNILIEDNNSTVRNVIMRVPQAQFSVTSISEETWPGHDWATVFQITNNGGQCPLDFAISDTSAWLSTNPASGSVPPNQALDITVIMSPEGLQPGSEHLSALIVTHEGNGSPYVIPVEFNISVSTPNPNSMPTEYALYQNYPNPFNAQTSIRFDLPQESRVKLVLFNVNGQVVATVIDGQYQAGRHSINYEAADLPSGMYLMKLEAGSYTSMKKMLLLK